MAKSKNHTNHNQNRKDHRNGIKRPKSQRFPSLSGVDPKYVRNLKFTKHHNHVARKNLAKSRKAKLTAISSDASPSKVAKRALLARQQASPQKSSWSLSSLLQNVTSYFTSEANTDEAKKRTKRTHSVKKSPANTPTKATKTAAKK